MINDIYKELYKIQRNGSTFFVASISSIDGSICQSITGKTFETSQDAYDYLFQYKIKNFVELNLDDFNIVHLKVLINDITKVSDDELALKIINTPLNSKEFDTNNLFIEKSIKHAVLFGFNTINKKLLDYILTNDEYQSTIHTLIPSHMYNLLDEFMDVGIKTCDENTLGSIYLTSTEKQIIMYDMNNLF